jgi:CII-binding regulator of phage lambda lysogenization HflD
MRKALEETLDQLHQQLLSAENLDDQERERLRQAALEIRNTLDDQHVSSLGLAERLQRATAQFEHSHPQLTNSIGRIADLLSQLGI